ncbi:hypothetical protein EJ08DRAFT_668074 [Tothia fuscella]|uniref:SH3 domain-containing protein n=1 Tax=Tothia fuscella TaxID=1048955 RepID=A0A9P4P0N3_9PEZI|nr:hypothetical protein EJ08DRAFT_668074 [Tothia fuscella]
MAKRKKRLVEYVRHKTMVEKGEKPDKKLEQDAELFKAVNETLKEELPKLYALTKKLVEACLLNFIELQAEWQYVWQRKLEPFVERKDDLLEMGITDFLCHVQLDFNADLMETEDRFNTFRICNGATLAEAQTFLSPTTTFTKDDDSSHKRPSQLSTKRTQSLTTEQSQASLSTPNLSSRMSDNMRRSPLVGSFPMPDGLYQPANVRGRTNSAMSSAGPTTPQSFSNWPGPSTYVPARPVTSYDQVTEPSPSVQSPQPSPGVPRLSLDAHSPRLETEPQFAFAEPAMPSMPGSFTPEERFSGMFHSALPMSDTPRASSPVTMDGDAKIIFLAASLFEFHIDGARKEAGYPYLTYQPGEIFDVIGQKGELWLAKNQDDSAKTIGWIWEKHFARILPEG